jgi:hypothetical protein
VSRWGCFGFEIAKDSDVIKDDHHMETGAAAAHHPTPTATAPPTATSTASVVHMQDTPKNA